MGFFFDEQIKSKENKNKLASLYGCKICPFKNMGKIQPTGNPSAKYYFLGGFPITEDIQNSAPISGDRIQAIYHALTDIDLRNKSIKFNNMVCCGISDDEKKNLLAYNCCLQNLVKDIEETKPYIIIGMGNLPLKYFIEGKDIHLWRGRKIPIKIGNHVCWYAPIYDPSFLIEFKKEFETKWERGFNWDIAEIFNFKEVSKVYPNPNDNGVTYVYGKSPDDFNTITEYLNKDFDNYTIDFETDSLDPKIGDIISCAIGNEEKVIVFPVIHENAWNFLEDKKETVYSFLINIFNKLKQKTIIAHENKFEVLWIKNKLKLNIDNTHDTKAMAYLLDERASKHESLLSLGILTKIYLGFNLKEFSPDIDRKDIKKASLHNLLKYNAMDVKYTALLAVILYQKLKNRRIFNLIPDLSETGETLAGVQSYGLDIDYEELNKLDTKYTGELELLLENFNNLDEVQKFKKLKGGFNPLSTDHVSYILTKIMNLSLDLSAKKKLVTDEKALLKFSKKGNKFCQWVLDYRGLNKLKSTYIDNVKAEDYEGKIYPEFNHLYTKTGRLSSGSAEE